MKHKIGVLGSGQVGQTLASGFIRHGFQVMIASRDQSKLAQWDKQSAESGSTGDFEDTAQFGEIIVLAVKGSAALDALHLAGIDNLSGKTIIDATNPIAAQAPENGVIKFFTNLDNSLMEQLQQEVPQAHFVKAFSCVGNALMVDPDFGGEKPSMFICGNDKQAKEEVTEILTLFNWETEDMGGVESARAIEPLCILWCIPGMLENRWGHAFKMLRQ